MNILYQWSRLVEKVLCFYRRRCFEGYLNIKTERLSIIGKIYLRNRKVHVGKNVTLYPGVMFQGEGDIYIGDNTYLENNTIVYSEKGHSVFIGKNCMIAPHVYITNTDHNTEKSEANMNTLGVICGDTVIEDNVWLAQDVTVLRGSYIESGAVVGAKALVKGRIRSDSIYVGIPAIKKKDRG